MARCVFASAAYLGDVAPFVGPANLLAERGHDVTFLVPAGFLPLLSGERFRLATYSSDFSPAAMHADSTHERLVRYPFLNQLRLARYWMRQGLVAGPRPGGTACSRPCLARRSQCRIRPSARPSFPPRFTSGSPP
jgi:UDP:flavonoid glycosyltransferase YjiC (YdhE family)